MQQTLPDGLKDTFLWCEELGYGWHSRLPMEYDGGYFKNYQALDNTPMGAALTRARLELVGKYVQPNYGCDIGIGGGRYVQESGGFGFDVCKDAVKWLQHAGVYAEPDATLQVATCWDSLEHVPDIDALLNRVQEWLFVSMPIYTDAAAVLTSKHFKPGEHLWYFTLHGFINYCEERGFLVMEANHAESELGREGIVSFAFKRVSYP